MSKIIVNHDIFNQIMEELIEYQKNTISKLPKNYKSSDGKTKEELFEAAEYSYNRYGYSVKGNKFEFSLKRIIEKHEKNTNSLPINAQGIYKNHREAIVRSKDIHIEKAWIDIFVKILGYENFIDYLDTNDSVSENLIEDQNRLNFSKNTEKLRFDVYNFSRSGDGIVRYSYMEMEELPIKSSKATKYRAEFTSYNLGKTRKNKPEGYKYIGEAIREQEERDYLYLKMYSKKAKHHLQFIIYVKKLNDNITNIYPGVYNFIDRNNSLLSGILLLVKNRVGKSNILEPIPKVIEKYFRNKRSEMGVRQVVTDNFHAFTSKLRSINRIDHLRGLTYKLHFVTEDIYFNQKAIVIKYLFFTEDYRCILVIKTGHEKYEPTECSWEINGDALHIDIKRLAEQTHIKKIIIHIYKVNIHHSLGMLAGVLIGVAGRPFTSNVVLVKIKETYNDSTIDKYRTEVLDDKEAVTKWVGDNPKRKTICEKLNYNLTNE